MPVRNTVGTEKNCLKALSQQVHTQVAQQQNKNADWLIWSGIVDSTLAGEEGGLTGLGLVKQARQALEASLKLDPQALSGSAWTSLGVLYYQVPGWPIGFGDKDKAREYLNKALALNPDGIDSNYFYGDFLLNTGNNTEARRYLEKALKAPARPGRELADSGRRKEIEHDLAQLEQ
ncbi:tetratricopeptide repeat protein [Mangrovibacter sp. SLW1]